MKSFRPKEVEHWLLTAPREKLVKVGAKVVGHGRYVTLQLAEVALPRKLFRKIPRRIDKLRPKPAPPRAEKIGGKVKTAGEVRLNGRRPGQTAFQTTSNHKNRVVGWLRKNGNSPDGKNVGTLAANFELSGECRYGRGRLLCRCIHTTGLKSSLLARNRLIPKFKISGNCVIVIIIWQGLFVF